MAKTKVTFKLGGPVIMQALSRFNPLDGIVAYAAVERYKLSRSGETITDEDIIAITDNLPFKKIATSADYIYACSIPSFDCELPYQGRAGRRYDHSGSVTLHKMISTERLSKFGIPMDYIIAGVRKGYIASGSGPYKTAMPMLYPMLARSVSWVFDGDRAAVSDLLADITHVGKKAALGYGRILDKIYEDTDDDIVRMLPATDYVVSDPVYLARPRPAYWMADGKVIMGLGKLLS